MPTVVSAVWLAAGLLFTGAAAVANAEGSKVAILDEESAEGERACSGGLGDETLARTDPDGVARWLAWLLLTALGAADGAACGVALRRSIRSISAMLGQPIIARSSAT
jgi:hypothetical protein